MAINCQLDRDESLKHCREGMGILAIPRRLPKARKIESEYPFFNGLSTYSNWPGSKHTACTPWALSSPEARKSPIHLTYAHVYRSLFRSSLPFPIAYDCAGTSYSRFFFYVYGIHCIKLQPEYYFYHCVAVQVVTLKLNCRNDLAYKINRYKVSLQYNFIHMK